MKRALFLLLFCLYITDSVSQQDIVINHNAPEITFETELIDLGTFMQYDDPSSKCEFKFTNTGKEPLIIEKAKGSCGCTVPEWPKEPIMAGENGVIKVNYDEKRVVSFQLEISHLVRQPKSSKVIVCVFHISVICSFCSVPTGICICTFCACASLV